MPCPSRGQQTGYFHTANSMDLEGNSTYSLILTIMTVLFLHNETWVFSEVNVYILLATPTVKAGKLELTLLVLLYISVCSLEGTSIHPVHGLSRSFPTSLSALHFSDSSIPQL
jgi:hypothetical protein